ncbi:hypothetical protein CgunFtcFv8_022859 [Champsocephalus gunnari]|uniref:Uncharacterized protein n=1 Tax=Champsocephalus gunnari TaxID=52237 RepID=A0AAN8HKC0_CHAGU|nr:hypothetical protein CgunFtcFv8_022859 [Champsocephalus gunnari]
MARSSGLYAATAARLCWSYNAIGLLRTHQATRVLRYWVTSRGSFLDISGKRDEEGGEAFGIAYGGDSADHHFHPSF